MTDTTPTTPGQMENPVAVPLYHRVRFDTRLCSESVGCCPYGGAENHYTSKRGPGGARASMKADPGLLHLRISGRERTDQIVLSKDWGAAISDVIDEHIVNHGCEPEQISFTLIWDEKVPDEDQPRTVSYLFEAQPRRDPHFGTYTNIYRLACWDPTDKASSRLVRTIVERTGDRDGPWSYIPSEMKWEAAFSKFKPVVDMNRNDWAVNSKTLREEDEQNKRRFQSVLSNPNVVDRGSLIKLLTDERYLRAVEYEDTRDGVNRKYGMRSGAFRYETAVARKASQILSLVKATENNLIGPHNAFERGLGFFSMDTDRGAIVEANLATTSVRGRNLRGLASGAQKWMTGTWHTDDKSATLGETSQLVYTRAKDPNGKAIPDRSAMTFWTANTPDGARWELGLNVCCPAGESHKLYPDRLVGDLGYNDMIVETGEHRVRHFDPRTPNHPTDIAAPEDAIAGFVAMKQALENRYGPSSQWGAELRRDMVILADIVESVWSMKSMARRARAKGEKHGMRSPQQAAARQAKQEAEAVAKVAAKKNSFFGRLFG